MEVFPDIDIDILGTDIYIYMYIYMYIYICTYEYIYIYIYVCVFFMMCVFALVSGLLDLHVTVLNLQRPMFIFQRWKNHGRKTMMFPCPCCRSMVSIGFLPFLVLFGPAFWGPKEPFVGPRRAVGSAVSWDPSAESPQSLAPGDG